MMNIRALGLLLSSLGAVMVLSPEPYFRRINRDVVIVEAANGGMFGDGIRQRIRPAESAKHATEAAKLATEDVVNTVSDYAKQTGEGIRHAGAATYGKVSDVAAGSKEKLKNAVGGVMKDAWDIGHESKEEDETRIKKALGESADHRDRKVPSKGWESDTVLDMSYRAKETISEPSVRAKDSLEAIHANAGRARDTVAEGAARVRDAVLESMGRAKGAVSESTGEARDILSERSESAYETANRDLFESTGKAKGAVYDTTNGVKDAVYEGTVKAKDVVAERTTKVKDTVVGVADRAAVAVAESAGEAKESAGKVRNIGLGATGKARDVLGEVAYIVGDAAYSVGDTVKGVEHEQHHGHHPYPYPDHDEETVSSKIARAREALKERVQEAAQYQPNLGQGLGYYSIEEGGRGYDGGAYADFQGRLEDGSHKLGEYTEEVSEEAKLSAEEAIDNAAEKLSAWKQEQQEDGDVSLEVARNKVNEYYDAAKDAALRALPKQELVLEKKRSLELARKRILAYYDKAKHATLSGLEIRKEKLALYLRTLRERLVAGQDGVVQYAMSSVNNVKSSGAEIVEESKGKVNEMEAKVNESLKSAGKWAQDKMAKLNEKEEMALDWLRKSVISVVRLLHLFLFSSVYGSSLWVTFVSGFVLSRNVSRQQFGMVQSKIFPIYYRIVGCGIALLIATHALLHPWPSADASERLQFGNMAAALSLTVINVFLLEPRATKWMLEKLRMEKEEGRGDGGGGGGEVAEVDHDEYIKLQLAATSNQLKRFHDYNNVANLGMLAGLTWHLWYLNRRLVI